MTFHRIRACISKMLRVQAILCGLAALLLLWSIPVRSHALQTTLNWDAVQGPGLVGYNVYYGTASQNYTTSIPVGNVTSYTVSGLQDGQDYYFAVTALDNSGLESGFSNEAVSFATQTYSVAAIVSAGSGALLVANDQPDGVALVTITPGTGYHLATLTDNGTDVTASVVGNVYAIANITGPHTVVAAFAENNYNIAAASGGNGSITASSQVVYYGDSAVFVITPASGYTLTGLTDNGVAVTADQGPSGTFTYTIMNVADDHTLNATFALPPPPPIPAMGTWGFILTACAVLCLAMRRKIRA